jgi:CobW/HypB/UreG, nucleotide-binding domain
MPKWVISLFNHLLRNREGKRVAVTVNDMSEVNTDVALVRDGGVQSQIRFRCGNSSTEVALMVSEQERLTFAATTAT